MGEENIIFSTESGENQNKMDEKFLLKKPLIPVVLNHHPLLMKHDKQHIKAFEKFFRLQIVSSFHTSNHPIPKNCSIFHSKIRDNVLS